MWRAPTPTLAQGLSRRPHETFKTKISPRIGCSSRSEPKHRLEKWRGEADRCVAARIFDSGNSQAPRLTKTPGRALEEQDVQAKLLRKLTFKLESRSMLPEAEMKRIEVTISVDDKRITLEGPEDFVRTEIERLATLRTGAPPVSPSPAASHGSDQELAAAPSERDFVAQKQPQGHLETVAVLAYFLSKAGQKEFRDEDMRRAYLRAGVRPPKVVAQALRDSKNVKDYIEVGTKKGTFRLSPHGERTVLFDLPRKAAAKAAGRL